MAVSDENYLYLLERFGPPAKTEPLPEASAAALEGRLPAELLRFWRAHGLGLWLDGRVQFCDPLAYAGVVRTLLQGDPQFQPARTHLYAFSAFGELYLWNEDWQRLIVELPFLCATASCTRPGWAPVDPDGAVIAPIMAVAREEAGGVFDEDGELLLARARATLGELDLGECYGFVPALEFGGIAQLEDVRRLRAREHFAFLAQLGPVRLFDYSTGASVFVRELGGGA